MEKCWSLAGSNLRAPIHRRAASDSLAAFRPSLIKPGVGNGGNFALGEVPVEPSSIDNNNDSIYHFNSYNVSETSSSPISDKKTSSGDQVTLFTDSSTGIELKKWGPTPSYVPGMDSKKIKRMLANRKSAQKSRLRKLQYVDRLKRDIDSEEAKLSVLSPQVSNYETRCKMMEIRNNEMKEEMEDLENEKASKEAEFQALMEELQELFVAYMLMQKGE